MSEILTLDIETVRQPDLGMYPVDERWVAEQREKWTAEQPWAREVFPEWVTDQVRAGTAPHARTGVAPSLHPSTAQIVSVAFGTSECVTAKVLTDYGRTESPSLESSGSWYWAESNLISWALNRLGECPGPEKPWFPNPGRRLVTFGGKGFDIPMIRVRAALLGVPARPIAWRQLLHPHDDGLHADLRLVLGNGDRRARGTQAWWAERFGVSAQERGAEVQAMVDAGQWEELRAYNAADAQTLLDLWEKVGPYV